MKDVTDGQPSYPRVSVVVPTHNRPDLLGDAVASIVGQDYPGIVECIVVHDGEPADTSRADDDPRRPVVVVENTRTRGLTGVRNSGLGVATGELIGWCDDDDTWHSSKLTRQVELLQSTPGAPGVGASYRLVTPEGRSVTIEAPKRLVTQRDVLTHANGPLGLHSSTALVRRSAYDRIGGYDESLPESRLEDLEFFLRLAGIAPIPVGREPLVDVRYDPMSTFVPQRRRTMAETAQILLSRYPEFDQVPAARARMSRRIAANYSEAGMHRDAARWAREALRLNRRDHRAMLILACGLVGIRLSTTYRVRRRIGYLVYRDRSKVRLRNPMRHAIRETVR